MVKSALEIASEKQAVSVRRPSHVFVESTVARGSIEHTSESPSRFTTKGQQRIASPIVALSRGTGTMYNVYKS
jgi:hypothetical protein